MKVKLPSGQEVTLKALTTTDKVEKIEPCSFDHLIVAGKCKTCGHEITLKDLH